MIGVGNRRIFLARAVVDMRRSFNRLIGMVEGQFGKDSLSGDAFVFVGRDRRRLKILLFERGGYWVLCRRLERGTFALPALPLERDSSITLELDAATWSLLLEGVKAQELHRSKRWNPTCR